MQKSTVKRNRIFRFRRNAYLGRSEQNPPRSIERSCHGVSHGQTSHRGQPQQRKRNIAKAPEEKSILRKKNITKKRRRPDCKYRYQGAPTGEVSARSQVRSSQAKAHNNSHGNHCSELISMIAFQYMWKSSDLINISDNDGAQIILL